MEDDQRGSGGVQAVGTAVGRHQKVRDLSEAVREGVSVSRAGTSLEPQRSQASAPWCQTPLVHVAFLKF